ASATVAVTASPAAAACPRDEPCPSIRLEPDHGPPGTFPVIIADPQGILISIGWAPDREPCIWWLKPGQTLADLPAGIEATEDADPAFVDGHWQTAVPEK